MRVFQHQIAVRAVNFYHHIIAAQEYFADCAVVVELNFIGSDIFRVVRKVKVFDRIAPVARRVVERRNFFVRVAVAEKFIVTRAAID